MWKTGKFDNQLIAAEEPPDKKVKVVRGVSKREQREAENEECIEIPRRGIFPATEPTRAQVESKKVYEKWKMSGGKCKDTDNYDSFAENFEQSKEERKRLEGP